VTLDYDGSAVVAQRGEPVAIALLAGGHLALARSPKFHRPRGPSCLRAGCDGCLARVDGVPNVMTCRTAAAEGMRVETQNVVGPGRTDVLRAADWFFPDGMNHHELLAGVPGLQPVLQSLARRVAGLGKLPSRRPDDPVVHSPASSRRSVDVLVVGSGPSGAAAAVQLEKRGRSVEVIDDALEWGGAARWLEALGASAWTPLLREFRQSADAGRIALRLRTTAAGIYGDDVLVARDGDPAGVELVTARTLVLAPGAHDGVVAFEGNDLPGVMSARAACALACHGVALGRRVVVALSEGAGPFGEVYARAAPDAVVVRGAPARARGSARVREVTIDTSDGERRLACDALVVDAAPAPAYELCAQAGAVLAHRPAGFVVQAPAGRIRPGVFAAGEVTGTALEAPAMLAEALAVSDAATSAA